MRVQSLCLTLALCAVPVLIASEEPPAQHVKWMKESGELQGKIRKNEDVAASAQRLAAIYKEVEGFWGPRSEVGGKAAKDLQVAANALASAATAGDATAVTAASRGVGGACRTCHDAHREKISENVYKIK